MVSLLIIPAIDLRAGKCVRLHQGDYAQETIYGDDPVAMASGFLQAGAEIIHVVDLDGAKTGKPEHLSVLKGIVGLGAKVQTGGGVRTLETIATLLDAGLERVILGSILVKDRNLAETAFREFGGRLVAGLDVRDEQVAVSGWMEQTNLDLYETADWLLGLGCDRFIVTDIATDGTLAGPNLAIASKFMNRFPGARYIVSGGVGSIDDLLDCEKVQPSVEGVITGKAIYDGRIDVNEALARFQSHS